MTKMCADAHVSSSASQVLVFTICYVLMCNRINIFLCKAKVYNMYDVVTTGRSTSNEEILRFDVTVQQTMRMDVLQPSYLI